MNKANYGIEGHPAPELQPFPWIDKNGEKTDAIQLKDHSGKFIVLYCFQSWCPGCHSVGFPSLQSMIEALADNDQVKFFCIQTVFEGHQQNSLTEALKTQQKYDLKIPFGHDEGTPDTGGISSTMRNFRTGGTPWFIFIDQSGKVVFNDFHLDTENAIKYLKTIK